MKLLPLATAAFILCAGPTMAASTSDAAHALAGHLADTMKKCWFSGDRGFAPYAYTPEVNAGAPRILLVSRKEPHGRPLLVVEPTGSKSADAYGPLLAGALAPRIIADLTRWLKGNGDCV
ncbi:MAG TPA: hypothetical protein VHA70_12775 [Bauldia sp.]|nr:hypothetical protein [Bauldia sp.]